MKIEIRDHAGKASGEKELDDFVFKTVVNKNAIYEVLRQQLANKRQGTASVKTVATVHGTTAKPWRQKGTGRARAGTNKSPLWRGGGVIFGPHARDFGYRVPKKLSRSAICSVLSLAVKEQRLRVLQDLNMDEYQTRRVVEILGAVTNKRRVVMAVQVPPVSERTGYAYMRKSAANIPWLRVVNVEALEIKDLYYAGEVVLSVSAVDVLNRLGGEWKQALEKMGSRPVASAVAAQSVIGDAAAE